MSNQRNEWHTWADLIAEKVQEYIDEADVWSTAPFLLINKSASEVELGYAEEDYPGEKSPVHSFILEAEDGTLSPDYDKIDDYTSSWFDLRQI